MGTSVPHASQATPPVQQISKAALWTRRILTGVIVLFLLFDGITKVMKVPAVLQVSAQIGFPENLIVPVGITLLVCTVVYIIPSTSTLGAILLTGYLGGAVCTQLRAGKPFFSQTLFPAYFGVLVWITLYLRESRLRSLIPFRS